MHDRRIPVKDLLSILDASSIRHFNTKFKKEWKNYSRAHEDNDMIVMGDDLLFSFDFARGIVSFNPTQDLIENFKVFNLYCQVFSEYYGLKSSTSDLTTNWWLVSIDVEDHTQSSAKSQLKAGSIKGFDAVYANETDGSVHVQAEVIAGDESSELQVGQLRGLFERVSKFEKQE